MRMMSYQIENTSKGTEVIIRNQIENLELKSTITELKISLEGINSRFELAKGRNSKI